MRNISSAVSVQIVAGVLTPIVTVERVVVELPVVGQVKGIVGKVISAKNVAVAGARDLNRPAVP